LCSVISISFVACALMVSLLSGFVTLLRSKWTVELIGVLTRNRFCLTGSRGFRRSM